MAADAYIKVAVAQLRDAAQELQNEARTAQVDTYDEQRRLQKEASDAEYEKLRLNTEKAGTSEDGRRHALDASIREKERVAAAKLQQVSQMGGAAAGVVNAKTALASRLQGIASQLESLEASAR